MCASLYVSAPMLQMNGSWGTFTNTNRNTVHSTPLCWLLCASSVNRCSPICLKILSFSQFLSHLLIFYQCYHMASVFIWLGRVGSVKANSPSYHGLIAGAERLLLIWGQTVQGKQGKQGESHSLQVVNGTRHCVCPINTVESSLFHWFSPSFWSRDWRNVKLSRSYHNNILIIQSVWGYFKHTEEEI